MLQPKTKYKQIVNYVLNGINDGTLQKGGWLPSVNEFRMLFNVSRETVFAGLAELKAKGLIDSCAGKGCYVTGMQARVEKNIFMLFNEMNAFKQTLYNAFVSGLKADDTFNIQFHNYNRKVFEVLLREANGHYDTFVLMPGKFKGLKPLLDSLSGRVLLLDHCHQELKDAFGGVVQNFEADTYNALISGEAKLQRYTSFYMVQSDAKEPYERYYGMERFCEEHGKRHRYLNSLRGRTINEGDLFMVADDTDLVTLLKAAATQGLTPGQEFGVISYNDTPLKEILAGGITTLSTDFAQMGRTMAALIRKQTKGVIDNPCKLVIRASI
jgi:DNA-binding transcriptional regulator YhcF (GntR family)